METSYIKEFVVLAKVCNFQEASEILNIPQPYLSKHIKKLEDDLNAPLFDRTTRSVKLNKNGAIFLKYAQQILCLFDHSANLMVDQTNVSKKTLNIGFERFLGQFGIVEALASFIKSNSSIPINIINKTEDQLVDMLLSGQCDFVFSTRHDPSDSNLNSIIYKSDCMSAALPLDHPLAGHTSISIGQLENENFILHDTDSAETKRIIKLCNDAGFNPNVYMTVKYRSAMLKLVASGLGITIMSHSHIESILEAIDVAIVDIEPLEPFVVNLLFPIHHELSLESSVFLQFLKDNPMK